MTTGTILPIPKFTGFDNNGDIIPGGKLFTYSAGTTTKVATYTDSALTVANTNPVILDSSGRATVYLTPGVSYKLVLSPSTDTDPPTNAIWTQDNIAPYPPFNINLDIVGTAGATITAGNVLFLSDGTGGHTAGKWYLADSANDYSSSIANSIGFAPASIASGSTGSIRLIGSVSGLAGLTAGTLYYIGTAGTLTASAPANARLVAQADSTTSVVVSEWLLNSGGNMIVGNKEFTGNVQIDGTLTQQGVASFTGGSAQFTVPPAFQPGTSTGTFAPVSGVISANITPVNSINGTSDMMTYTVPANVLSATGKAIRVIAHFTTANNANNKALNWYWNGVLLVTFNIVTSQPVIIDFQGMIYKTGASTQRLVGQFRGQYTNAATFISINTTGAATDTATVVSKFTAVSLAGSDIVQTDMLHEVVG